MTDNSGLCEYVNDDGISIIFLSDKVDDGEIQPV